INHYFLCDKGRFGYGYVNRDDRPRQPQQRRGDDWLTINAEQAERAAADMLYHAKRTIGIGSPRASVESNFALRELVGAENFFSGLSAGEQHRLEMMLEILPQGGIYTPSLREMENYDAVLVLGEDLTQTAARVALSVRQAVK
ncbi:NADH-quinone oxidoreductase subunit G, partial [Vibrio alginolyticus]|nr:NADH-quinone oxidoreductase subunit G [Vibrio alginolyticus]